MTIKEVVKKYKLDRRRKWFAYCGNVVYNHNYTRPCSGCTESRENTISDEIGGGCDECGYTGKRRDGCPVPAMIDGKLIETTSKDFTKA